MWKLAHVFVTTLKMSLSFNRVRVIIVSRVILKMQNNIYLIYYIYCMYTHTHTHTHTYEKLAQGLGFCWWLSGKESPARRMEKKAMVYIHNGILLSY